MNCMLIKSKSELDKLQKTTEGLPNFQVLERERKSYKASWHPTSLFAESNMQAILRLSYFLALYSIFSRNFSCMALKMQMQRESIKLFDVPVSNHGARVRMIARAKNINLQIIPPSDIGGLKSESYLKLNPQGKMPLLVTTEGYAIAESDTIAKYLLAQYADAEPSFVPSDIMEMTLSEQIVRAHDIYITPIQACMYRAPGSVFSTHGTDRKAALKDLKNQLTNIELQVDTFRKLRPQSASGPFLCGREISVADVTLFPTLIFCTFMLPQFFGWQEGEFMGPHLSVWYKHMSEKEPLGQEVHAEMLVALDGWKKAGRFDAIMKEMETS